jgi:nicotinamidase-related amidase
MSPTPRLTTTTTALLVVDIQERLLPAMFESDRVLQNSIRLAKGCRLLGVPAVASEQYRKDWVPQSRPRRSIGRGAALREGRVQRLLTRIDLRPSLKGNYQPDRVRNRSPCCVLQTGLDILQTASVCSW